MRALHAMKQVDSDTLIMLATCAVFLTTYVDHHPGSAQYHWFIADMTNNLDRSITPWVVVVGAAHPGEGCFVCALAAVLVPAIALILHLHPACTPCCSYNANIPHPGRILH